MAGPSTSTSMALLGEEGQRLKGQLAQLRIFKSWAENSLLQMGLDVHVARTRGWVSESAELRRKKTAKAQATKDAKWAEILKNRRWIHDQRKKVGLPVDGHPTPSPSEAAYGEQQVAGAATRATVQTLRNRIRRASHQLLIAAAIGKQYRMVNGIDRLNHNAPGADIDVHGDTGLTTTTAMARAFHNWANHEKANRPQSRSRSHLPPTVVSGGQTAGSEDTPSGSRGPLGNDNTGIIAAITLIYDTEFWNEDDADDEDDENDENDGNDTCGLASLGFNDVSDEIRLTAYSMLAAVENVQDDRQDWAELLATKVLKYLSPPQIVGLFEKGLRSGPDDLSSGFPDSPNGTPKHKAPKSVVAQWLVNAPEASKSENLGPHKTKSTMKSHNQRAEHFPTSVGSKAEERPNRKGDKLATPSPSLWDHDYWQVGEDDGKIWSGKPASWTHPIDNMETGFITWEEQERRFPRLDDWLRMREVGRSKPTIYNPATVDTEVWDPFNRAIMEAKTGKREPLHLNTITMLSLDRWMASGFGIDFPRVPIPQPPNPPVEEKKQTLRSAAYSTLCLGSVKKEEGEDEEKPGEGEGLSGGSLKAKGTTKKQVAFSLSEFSPPATPTKLNTSLALTNKYADIASIHYPLKARAAQSISRSHPIGIRDTEQRDVREQVVTYYSPSGMKIYSPPTPYPWTPTVALYEGEEETQDEEEELAAYFDSLRSGGDSGDTENGSGKRAATDDATFSPASKKKRKTEGGGSDAEKQTAASRDGDAVGLGVQGLGVKQQQQQQQQQQEEEVHSMPSSPSSSSSPSTKVNKKYRVGEKNSVRFDLSPSEGGPSKGMRDNARRALQRFGRTNSSLGSFR
ncbi:hypothetical protein F5Y09DRAFT_85148 [Xylaria sp. FL1042]|nr:hypothetical protein F5Y09DRAFT_85148 [Xylaria sp. FL1042]